MLDFILTRIINKIGITLDNACVVKQINWSFFFGGGGVGGRYYAYLLQDLCGGVGWYYVCLSQDLCKWNEILELENRKRFKKLLFLSIIGIAYESIGGTQPFSYTPKPLLMWMTCNVGLLIQV